MATPYAVLKTAIQSLSRAHVQLDKAIYLADDRKATMSDLRTLFAYRDQIRQAEKDLGAVLSRLLRLRAPPAGEKEA